MYVLDLFHVAWGTNYSINRASTQESTRVVTSLYQNHNGEKCSFVALDLPPLVCQIIPWTEYLKMSAFQGGGDNNISSIVGLFSCTRYGRVIMKAMKVWRAYLETYLSPIDSSLSKIACFGDYSFGEIPHSCLLLSPEICWKREGKISPYPIKFWVCQPSSLRQQLTQT